MSITSDGTFEIPAKPTTGDWAILVTCRDLGTYETEPIYQDAAEIDEIENFALNASVLCSSFTEEGWNAQKSNDGDKYTYWCASNGDYPQRLVYDLGTKKVFNRVEIQINSAQNPDNIIYIYGSNTSSAYNTEIDTTNWTEIKNLTIRDLDTNGKIAAFDDVEYQYVRIEFTGTRVNGNWATASEINIYKASEQQRNIPVYSGEKQMLNIDCVGGAIYSIDGVLTDTKSKLVDANYETCWKPFAPAGTQTIIMDLQEQKNLTGIIVTLGKDEDGKSSYLPEYRVEVSDNGSDWTILADATLRSKQSTIDAGYLKMYEALSGEWRYVKLFWLGAPNNEMLKSIAEIEVYAMSGDNIPGNNQPNNSQTSSSQLNSNQTSDAQLDVIKQTEVKVVN